MKINNIYTDNLYPFIFRIWIGDIDNHMGIDSYINLHIIYSDTPENAKSEYIKWLNNNGSDIDEAKFIKNESVNSLDMWDYGCYHITGNRTVTYDAHPSAIIS